MLGVLVALVGAASMFFHAAHQSYLPRLVPMDSLPAANARIEQSMTAAEAVGPLLGGALVRFFSAPVAILFNAGSKAVSAVLMATIRVEEPAPRRQPDRHLWREMREGGSWVYRHRVLAPYAVSLHLWFFFNSAIMTIFVLHATEELGLGALTVGLVLSCAGVSGVVGAGLAPRAAERFGLGRVCVIADWLHPLAFLFLLTAPPGPNGAALLVTAARLDQHHPGDAGSTGSSTTPTPRTTITERRQRDRRTTTVDPG